MCICGVFHSVCDGENMPGRPLYYYNNPGLQSWHMRHLFLEVVHWSWTISSRQQTVVLGFAKSWAPHLPGKEASRDQVASADKHAFILHCCVRAWVCTCTRQHPTCVLWAARLNYGSLRSQVPWGNISPQWESAMCKHAIHHETFNGPLTLHLVGHRPTYFRHVFMDVT